MTDTQTLERIVKRLTGKNVFVRRRYPARLGALGQACKSEAGAYFIDLTPELTGWTLIEVLLHEAAHLKLDHVTTPSPAAHAPAGSIPLFQGVHRGNLAAYQERERQADTLAGEWLDWLRAHGGEPESLLTYWPPEIEQAIERGVDRALQELGLKRR